MKISLISLIVIIPTMDAFSMTGLNEYHGFAATVDVSLSQQRSIYHIRIFGGKKSLFASPNWMRLISLLIYLSSLLFVRMSF